jgi:hypothetical protein
MIQRLHANIINAELMWRLHSATMSFVPRMFAKDCIEASLDVAYFAGNATARTTPRSEYREQLADTAAFAQTVKNAFWRYGKVVR